jgi:hypothetical protein
MRNGAGRSRARPPQPASIDRAGWTRVLPVLLVAGMLATTGCLSGGTPRSLSPPDEELLRAKADPRLRREAKSGGTDPFAAIAVYRNDVFLDQSEALGRASLTVLNELGNTVILLMHPGQIVPALKDPSLRKLAWFGPQGLLARLDPSLEFDMLTRFGAGTEGRDVSLLLRFVDAGGAEEERQVAAAGFRAVTRAGPNWVVAGPMSGLPKLLESDRIVYIEGGDRAGVPVTEEVPHSKDTLPELKEREKANPLPPTGDRAIRSHKVHRAGIDNDTSIPPKGDQTGK